MSPLQLKEVQEVRWIVGKRMLVKWPAGSDLLQRQGFGENKHDEHTDVKLVGSFSGPRRTKFRSLSAFVTL